MITIQIAGINIGLNNRYPELEALCRGFETTEPPAFCLEVSPEEIAQERRSLDQPFSDGYLETVCIYRQLALRMLSYNVFILHASVIALDGEGYAFLAPSGTGKTTQTRLWLEHFGNRAQVVNGDKPLIRMVEAAGKTQFIACGTPWMGKEGMGSNSTVPLKALFFVQRSQEVSCTPADSAQTVDRLFRQLLMPRDYGQMDRLLTMVDKLVQTVPCYTLRCDMTEASVVAAWLAAQ